MPQCQRRVKASFDNRSNSAEKNGLFESSRKPNQTRGKKNGDGQSELPITLFLDQTLNNPQDTEEAEGAENNTVHFIIAEAEKGDQCIELDHEMVVIVQSRVERFDPRVHLFEVQCLQGWII